MALLDTIKRKTYGSAAIRYTRWQMERSGLNDLFRQRPDGAIPPQSFDLWNLYREVRKYRPANVVEFGVGCSTFVLAEALRRNGHGHLYTVDASKHWLDVNEAELPEELQPYVTFIHSPVRVTEHEGEKCHLFELTPRVPFDLVYLDAPDTADIPDWPKDEPVKAADPLYLSGRARIIVDGRRKNVEFLQRQMNRKPVVNELFRVSTFP